MWKHFCSTAHRKVQKQNLFEEEYAGLNYDLKD